MKIKKLSGKKTLELGEKLSTFLQKYLEYSQDDRNYQSLCI